MHKTISSTVDEFTGIIKYYNSGKGYGFIVPDRGGEDILVESTELKAGVPDEGDRVVYRVESLEQGYRALEVRVV